MAALCPQCGTSLDQDFGVVSCTHCHAVLAIDINGEVEIQSEAQVIAPEFQEEEVIIPAPSENLEQVFEEIPEQNFAQAPIEEEIFISEPAQALTNSSSGVISYHVTIEGIDTKDLRRLLEDSLTDNKFPWSARDVVQQTNQGTLELGPMNPVAASVLVRKLKDLPLTVSWTQRIYE